MLWTGPHKVRAPAAFLLLSLNSRFPRPARQVWDIAAMRIDIGLVIDKLHPTNREGASASPPSLKATCSQSNPSAPATSEEMHPAAFAELAQGLRWIWICLGKDSGLPAENAALEACRSNTNRSLLHAAAAV